MLLPICDGDIYTQSRYIHNSYRLSRVSTFRRFMKNMPPTWNIRIFAAVYIYYITACDSLDVILISKYKHLSKINFWHRKKDFFSKGFTNVENYSKIFANVRNQVFFWSPFRQLKCKLLVFANHSKDALLLEYLIFSKTYLYPISTILWCSVILFNVVYSLKTEHTFWNVKP